MSCVKEPHSHRREERNMGAQTPQELVFLTRLPRPVLFLQNNRVTSHYECHLIQRSRAALTCSPGRPFWKLRDKGALEPAEGRGCVWDRAAHPLRSQPRVNSHGTTFTGSGDSTGKHVTDAFPDKGDEVPLQLPWGFNYIVQLHLLPLETNCMCRLVVFYECHTGSKIPS